MKKATVILLIFIVTSDSLAKGKRSTLEKLIAQDEAHYQAKRNRHQEANQKMKEAIENEKTLPVFEMYHGIVKRCPWSRQKGADCQDFNPTAFASEKSVLNIHTNGRLGNQMVTFASMYSASKFLDIRPYLYRDQFAALSEVFVGLANVPVIDEEICNPCAMPWEDFKIRDIATNESLRTGHAFHITTYAAAPKLIKEYLPEIREAFKFKPNIKKIALQRINEAVTKFGGNPDPILVGIHVRRTDMLSHIQSYHRGKVVGVGYFKKAKKYFRDKFGSDKVIFLMVSDDRPWLEKNLVDPGSFVVPEDGIGVSSSAV